MMLTYENAKEEDLSLLFSLNKALIDRYEDTAAIDYERVLGWVQQNLSASLPCFRRILADGTLAGFYCLMPAPNLWELDSLFVFPEFQNRGIGTQVLERCIRESSGSLRLYVFKSNADAVRLYSRLGFRVTAEAGTTRYIMEYSP